MRRRELDPGPLRRSPRSPLGWLAVLGVVSSLAGAPRSAGAEEPRRLTLADVVAIASEETAAVRAASAGIDAQATRVSSLRATLLPRLDAKANVFVWNEALELSFGPGMPGLSIRDQVTASASLSLAQPVTGFYAVLVLAELEQLGLDAAHLDRASARLDAAQRAVEAFFGALQARAIRDVTERSVAQVEAQLARARVLEKAGVLGTVDLLRLESARAAVLQGLVRARAGVEIADRAIGLTLDLAPGTAVLPIDDLPEPPPKVTLTAALSRNLAARSRPEIEASRKRSEQAAGGIRIAYSQLVPDVYAIATYQHAEGQGTFSPKDSAFAGLTLEWNLFEWGKTLDRIDEATARAAQAAIAAEATELHVAFDVERRTLDAGAIYEALGVAKSGLAAAEEAHRIQSVRFEQGAATTTDVLDTETDLARARTSYASARFEYYVAVAALARALGKLPTASPAELGAP